MDPWIANPQALNLLVLEGECGSGSLRVFFVFFWVGPGLAFRVYNYPKGIPI